MNGHGINIYGVNAATLFPKIISQVCTASNQRTLSGLLRPRAEMESGVAAIDVALQDLQKTLNTPDTRWLTQATKRFA